MKIIINTSVLLNPLTGIGNYTYQVSQQLATLGGYDYTYYYQGRFCDKLQTSVLESQKNGLLKTKKLINRVPVIDYLAKSGWRWFRDNFAGRFSPSRYDLYFEPSIMPIELPANKVIVTVHDLSFYYHPEWYESDTSAYLKRHFLKKILTVNRIITVSKTVKQEIIDILSIDQDLVDVIYNGVDHDVFKVYPEDIVSQYAMEWKIPGKFILFAGSLEPRKNLLRLLDAYLKLPLELRKEFKLVLVGFQGWKNRAIMERIYRLRGQVCYYGYLPSLELAYFYNRATVLVCPSLYEGFSLPPLEAMACGAPTMLSDIPVHRELYEDVALFTDPYHVGSMVDCLKTILENSGLRESLRKKGIAKALAFNWSETAKQHLLSFNKTIETFV